MKSISINGSKRESVGKKATKALRNAGQVPCVIYGGDQPVHFNAPELAFKDLVYTPNAHTVEIDVDGQTIHAILQDIQFHPVTDRILHIDFYQIFEDKPVVMNIPVHFEGTAKGVRNGGVLRKTNRVLRVKALPGNLPDYLVADITDLKIGSKLYVSALASDDYTVMHPDNFVVCQVRTSRTAVVDDEDDDDEDAGDVPATETDDTAAVAE
ncbi:50S ribosomal protein L25/general stress protein Ctc [Dokdonia sinensis]|uniref:Large ribosomal subunit protein bL25 n=1 Tax=Dokdonia sinensis TaxID=2479847 RepID=A0A3M0GF56_9FLAO|nr:50S ribosomal protein L25/general stress protein Ctc [Dokdonia sinensis]RMB63370.1 50S ribosomal protein L25/general stress protein Ctc [Dokdonia sinensis]